MASILQETKLIEKTLKDNNLLPRVIIASGEESYYLDRIDKAISANYIAPEDRETERIILYGVDATMSDVALHAQSTSLFSSKRLVVVRDAQLMTDFDKVAKLIPKIPNGTTLLVIYRGDLLGKKKYAKMFAEQPEDRLRVLESPAIRNNRDITAIISQVVNSLGTTIEERARQKLVELIGYNGSALASEIEKLSLAAGSAPITVALVEKLVGFSRHYSISELRKSVATHKSLQAITIAEAMANDEKNYPLPRILSTLFDFFSNLLVYHFIPNDQRTPANIAASLGLRSQYQADEYTLAGNLYSAKRTLGIVHAIRLTDARYKGADDGDYRAEALLQNLISYIVW